jgi:membrane protease YdiL (CAAX protease family)
MRAFIIFLIVLAGALIAAAVLTYPAWVLVELMSDQPIHRVMHRIAMLVALVGFIYLWRRYSLANRQSLGFDLRRREFLRQLLTGLGLGAAIILPLIAALYALDVRTVVAELHQNAALLPKLLLTGLASGLVVALIEETFFRGALFSAVRRESGIFLAIVLPSLLYASLHFLGGRLNVPTEQIGWGSGFAVLGEMFIKYQHPAAIADSFLALFFVGTLLALVRARTNSVAAPIGMHAAWVCVITLVRGTSYLNPDAPASWLVGSYDGVLGWGTLGYMVVIGVGYLAMTRGKPVHSNVNVPQRLTANALLLSTLLLSS